MDDRDPPPSMPPPRGDDGVRVTMHARRHPVRGIVGVGILAIAAFAGYRMLAPRAEPNAAAVSPLSGSANGANDDVHASSDASLASRMPRTQTAAMTMTPRDGEDPTADLSDYVLPGETPTMAQVIDALHARGIRTGLGAFNPPGTSPPLEGLEVPENFPLPEGYVRHQQATDDGQRIAPILMFHPDLRYVTVNGRRVPVPADRVVTPELAPPGMPLRRVRIPAPRDGSGSP